MLDRRRICSVVGRAQSRLIKRQIRNVLALHSKAQLALDQGLNEESEEVESE
jgi:hypothetical protein